MFLVERLFALIAYCSILLVVCILIEWEKSNYKVILSIYVVVLAAMGFFYVPYETADLYRINEYLDAYEHYSWDYFFNKRLNGNILEIDHIYYWLIARTGEMRLLPSITALLCYSCIFYIIIRTAKIYKIDRKYIAASVLFFMSIGNYIFVISGIRSMLGTCLLCFCFFRESIEKKFRLWHLLLYIVAGFIHNFVFILIVIRVLTSIFFHKASLFKKVIYIALVAIAAGLVVYFSSDYIREVLGRAEGYLNNEVFSYAWEYVICMVCGIVMVLGLLAMHKNSNKELKRHFAETKMFLSACLVIGVVFCFEFTICHRSITYIAPILSLPILMVSLQNQKGKGILHSELLLLTVVMLSIACARGSLCSLKFFVLYVR